MVCYSDSRKRFGRSPSVPRSVLSLISGFVMVFIVGCVGGDGDDSGAWDAAAGRDGSLLPRDASKGDGNEEPAVDFAVSGCPHWGRDETGMPGCEGVAPMELGFHPLVSRAADSYLWDFGDGSRSEEPDPVHRFDQIGSFTVSLMIRGDFGVLSASKEHMVQIRLSDLGEACVTNDTCRWGLCLCGAGDEEQACVMDFEGYCTAPCKFADCGRGMCVDLREGLRDVTSPPAWRQPLCLPGCLTDTDCSRPGTECRVVPLYDRGDVSSIPSWAKACLPPVLNSLGGQCRSPDGSADDAACLSGRCWDVGAFARCTAPCRAGTCPAGSYCVAVGRAQEGQCLVPCDGPQDCASDPLLECRGEGGSGDFSLTLLDEGVVPGLEFCAPKTCDGPQDCAPVGSCDVDSGGYCRPLF